MLKNDFKIARRNLIQNKFSGMLNIGVVAFGMTVAMLIGLWIYDDLRACAEASAQTQKFFFILLTVISINHSPIKYPLCLS